MCERFSLGMQIPMEPAFRNRMEDSVYLAMCLVQLHP